jgi:hypothetical protein
MVNVTLNVTISVYGVEASTGENLPGPCSLSSVVFPNRQQAQTCADVRGYAECSEIRRWYADGIRQSFRTLTLSTYFMLVHLIRWCGVSCYELSRLAYVTRAIGES